MVSGREKFINLSSNEPRCFGVVIVDWSRRPNDETGKKTIGDKI
jgi:hypothetical protein